MSFHLKKSKKIQTWPHGHVVGAKWCNIRCEARVVDVVVGKSPEGWWCEGMGGTTRRAVEIHLAGRTFFVDFEDGKSIEKLTAGRGDPAQEFCVMPVKQVVQYVGESNAGIQRTYRVAGHR